MVHASSSVIAARDEVFQYAASIVSIAAGALLRRSSLPLVPRGELRDLPYLDRSGRSRDRREHQFPLQGEAFDRPCDETGSRSRALWPAGERGVPLVLVVLGPGAQLLALVLLLRLGLVTRGRLAPRLDLLRRRGPPSDPAAPSPSAATGERNEPTCYMSAKSKEPTTEESTLSAIAVQSGGRPSFRRYWKTPSRPRAMRRARSPGRNRLRISRMSRTPSVSGHRRHRGEAPVPGEHERPRNSFVPGSYDGCGGWI